MAYTREEIHLIVEKQRAYFKSGETLVDTSFFLCFVSAVYGETKAHTSQLIRQVCEMHVIRQAVLPWLDEFRQGRLRQARHHDTFMEYVRQGIVFLDVLNNLWESTFRLERNTRKRV